MIRLSKEQMGKSFLELNNGDWFIVEQHEPKILFMAVTPCMVNGHLMNAIQIYPMQFIGETGFQNMHSDQTVYPVSINEVRISFY